MAPAPRARVVSWPVLEPADPSLVGCAPFHGDACDGRAHGEFGADAWPGLLVAVARDAYPTDKKLMRGYLRRLMRDYGMLPAVPLYQTAVEVGREWALDMPAASSARQSLAAGGGAGSVAGAEPVATPGSSPCRTTLQPA